jgi:hypothetical protein
MASLGYLIMLCLFFLILSIVFISININQILYSISWVILGLSILGLIYCVYKYYKTSSTNKFSNLLNKNYKIGINEMTQGKYQYGVGLEPESEPEEMTQEKNKINSIEIETKKDILVRTLSDLIDAVLNTNDQDKIDELINKTQKLIQ